MYPKSFIVASVALLSQIVFADDYKGNGNVDMTIGSDGPIFLGKYFSPYLSFLQPQSRISPLTKTTGDQTPWSVLDSLNQHCNGQTCNADPYTIATTLTNSAAGTNTPTNINSGTITVTVVDATISKDNDLAGMIEALKNLASQPQIHMVKTEKYCPGDDGTTPPPPGRRLARRDVTCDQENNPSIDQYSTAGMSFSFSLSSSIPFPLFLQRAIARWE